MGQEQLFDGRAKNYVSGRPGYAPGLLDEMEKRIGSGRGKTRIRIADIGSGTGKFSAQLLARGYEVYGIEPNGDMRSEAEKSLKGEENFHSIKGNAEDTTAESGFFDAVTCAQSFHWFAAEAFQKECRRILKREGMVFLIWNTRDDQAEINRQLYRLFQTYCPAFHGFSAGLKEDDGRIVRFFGGEYEKMRWENPIIFTEERFMARNLSSSYALQEGEPGFCDFADALKELYHRYEKNGELRMPNDTVAYCGHMGGSRR